MQILIKKATLLCPSSKFHLKKKDILIKNGIIEKISDRINIQCDKTIDQKNTFVSIGWMDIFSDFCDPGNEQKEDLSSGSKTAMAGGFTDVCLIPNLNPATNNKSSVDYLKSKSDLVNIHPIGAISNQLEGKNLAEMYDMKLAGAIAFSDGLKPVQEAGLLLKALLYVKSFDGIILQIPEDHSIAKHGLMNEGVSSTRLGLQGKPAIAESILIQRDLELLRYTDSHIHFTGISTQKSVSLIKQAKKEGLKVTCSVTPAHLLFTDNDLEHYQSVYKVNPPLRTEKDRLALIKAVEDDTIDCIATHHFPQDWDAKEIEFEYAKPGMIGLQTTLPLLLSISDKINIEKWVSLLCEKPRAIMRLPIPEIKEKATACLTVFSTDELWVLDKKSNQSKSSNYPFFNKTFKGKVLAVLNNHQIHFNE